MLFVQLTVIETYYVLHCSHAGYIAMSYDILGEYGINSILKMEKLGSTDIV